jgi:membrane associated rhomboid family serine protease
MRLPRIGSSKLVSSWILVTLAVSIVAAIDGGFLHHWLALTPARIFRGEVWRLVTWVLVVPSPLSLVFTCVVIYKFGGELAPRWGDRRLRRFVLELVLAAGVAGTLVGLVFEPMWRMERVGSWAVNDLLVIAWARQYPNAFLQLFYGMLTLGGARLIAFTVGVTCLVAIFVGPLWMVPELVACFGAFYYPVRRLHR